jgi:acyl-CoA thioester hydrolase
MEAKLYASWKDMDFNQHMKNTAFLEKADDVRLMFFVENDFPMDKFTRLKIGPVVFKDEVEYFKEVNLLDEIKITIAAGGLSEDGSRYIIRNEFFKQDGKMAARVTSHGTWLDLAERKVIVPPKELLMVLKSLQKTDDYKDLPSIFKYRLCVQFILTSNH